MIKMSQKSKLLFIYALFITTVPLEPSVYTFTVDSLCCITCLISSYLLYSYYGSAPTTRKTSINTALQLIATIFAVSLIRFWILSFFFNLLTEPTRHIFKAYTNIMCSLTSDRFIFYLFVSAFSSLFVLRCGMKLWPLQFVDLKHDSIGTSIILITGLYVTTEFIASLVRYQTFCPISYLNILNVLYSFDLEEPNSKRHSTPLLYIFISIGFYAEMIPKAVKMLKSTKRKWRRNVVVPVYTINLPPAIPILRNLEPSTSSNLDTTRIINELSPIEEESIQVDDLNVEGNQNPNIFNIVPQQSHIVEVNPAPTTVYDATQRISPRPDDLRNVLSNNYLPLVINTDSGNSSSSNFTLIALTSSFITFYIYNFANLTTTRVETAVIIMNIFQKLCTYMLPVYWISQKDNLQSFVVHRIHVWMHTYLPIRVTDRVKKWIFPSSVNPIEMY